MSGTIFTGQVTQPTVSSTEGQQLVSQFDERRNRLSARNQTDCNVFIAVVIKACRLADGATVDTGACRTDKRR